MNVNREELLRAVVWVQPGVATREFVEQSSCVVFGGGYLTTFNDEVCCRVPSGLPETICGAVPHKPLLTILQKLTDDKVEVTQDDGELLVTGAKSTTGLRMERDIFLPYEECVDKPGKWKKLAPDFPQAVAVVNKCASSDETRGELTCVHVHPERVEATDFYQAARYTLPTPVPKPFLVRGDSVKHVGGFGATELSVTDNWVHFRGSGVVHSYRKYAQEYKDIGSYFNVEGRKFVFPKGLDAGVGNAEIFSGESADENMVEVTLRPGKVVVKGVGVQGWHRELKESSYDGPVFVFRIPPELLKEMLSKYNECTVGKTRVLARGEHWCYVAGLCVGKKS